MSSTPPPSAGPPAPAPRPGGLLRRALGGLLAVAALGFVAVTIARHWEEVRAQPWQVDLPRLLLSTVLLVAVLTWGVAVWGRVLARFQDGRAPFPELFRIWFLSGIARYVPGKVWQFVAAAGLARRAGLAPVVLLTSLAVYMGFGLLTAAVVAALTVPLGDVGVAVPPGWGIAAAAGGALLLVHPAVINFCLRLIPKAFREVVLAWRGGWGDGMVLLGLSLVFWAVYAVAFWLFVDALVDVPASTLPLLGGINALSFLAGYLFFVVPAGLGVREAAITVLLASAVGGPAPAGVIAVASRLWIIAAELLGAGAALLLPTSTGEAPPPSRSAEG